jgi:hypothetical protein
MGGYFIYSHIYLEVLKTGDKVRFDRSDDSREIAIDRVDFRPVR